MSSSQSCMEVRHLCALRQRVITATQNPIDYIQDLRETRRNERADLVLQKTDKNQSEMELLTTALVIVMLSTTASANPTGSRRHHDADIADHDLKQGWLDGNNGWSWYAESTESSSSEDSSAESDQSESSESSESSQSESSEESSEEVLVTDQTTTVMTTTDMTTTDMTTTDMTTTDMTTTDMTTTDMTTTDMTTTDMEDGSTPTPEPDTMATDEPTVTKTTPPPATPTAPPCDVTQCVTLDIPTGAPITENRGDN